MGAKYLRLEYLRWLRNLYESNWLPTLIVISSLFQIGGILNHYIIRSQHVRMYDSIYIQYVGWYLTKGGVLYVEIFLGKPPLVYYLTAILSFLSLGNVSLHFFFNVLVSAIALAGTSVLIGVLIYELFGDEYAAILSGASLFVLPAFYWFPGTGIRPKYFALLFGLLAIYLVKKERLIAAGAVGALSPGFYEAGLIFYLLIFCLVFKEGSWYGVRDMVAGSLIVTMLTLIPIFWWGAFEEMITQAIIQRFLVVNTGHSFTQSAIKLIAMNGPGLLLIAIGMIGWVSGSRSTLSKTWWIGLGGVLFTLKILFVDYESVLDTMGFFVFVSLGAGITYYTLLKRRKNKKYDVSVNIHLVLIAVVGLLLLTSGLWTFGQPTYERNQLVREYTQLSTPSSEAGHNTSSFNYSRHKQDIHEKYVQKQLPDKCHLVYWEIEKKWLEMNNINPNTTKCLSAI